MTARERAALLKELGQLVYVIRTARSKHRRQAHSVKEKSASCGACRTKAALKDSSEKALQAFIERQTIGAQMMPQWLTAEEANKVIEGFKESGRAASNAILHRGEAGGGR
jgi:hypothetical protein